MTGEMRVDVMIGGVAKAGTSSVLAGFAQHPQARIQTRSEMMYFIDDREYREGLVDASTRYFDGSTADEKLHVGKLAALLHYPEAMVRLREGFPETQIVLVLRDPVERAYSAYWYARRVGREQLPIREALFADEDRHATLLDPGLCDYLGRGLYAVQLQALFTLFPARNVHVFRFEDLRDDPVRFMADVFGAVGLRRDVEIPERVHQNRAAMPRSQLLARALASQGVAKQMLRRAISQRWLLSVRNRTQRANEVEFSVPPMPLGIRTPLATFFRRPNLALEDLLGWDLTTWTAP